MAATARVWQQQVSEPTELASAAAVRRCPVTASALEHSSFHSENRLVRHVANRLRQEALQAGSDLAVASNGYDVHAVERV